MSDSLDTLLAHFGIDRAATIGRGGEATVFALDANRVLRVPHSGGVGARAKLLARLGPGASNVPFAIPEILEEAAVAGRAVTIERRLLGRPLNEALGDASGAPREALIRAYLNAADAIGDLSISEDGFGDLCRTDPLRSDTWRGYLTASAARSLGEAGPGLEGVDPAALAAALPEPERGHFVHMDAYPGNMLCADGRVTAVVDFGAVAMIGDRRMEVWSAAAYLYTEITREVQASDQDVARAWLRERGLAEHFPAAKRWVAAFWSFARDDQTLHRWCRRALLT